MTETITRWKKATEHLAQKLARKPTLKEVAKEMNLPLKKAGEINELITTTTSLSAPIGKEGTAQFMDLIEDESAVSSGDKMASFLQRERILEMLKAMTPREKEILTLRFGLEDGIARTLETTAKRFGISRERVRQIENNAIKKLKKQISEQKEATENL